MNLIEFFFLALALASAEEKCVSGWPFNRISFCKISKTLKDADVKGIWTVKTLGKISSHFGPTVRAGDTAWCRWLIQYKSFTAIHPLKICMPLPKYEYNCIQNANN